MMEPGLGAVIFLSLCMVAVFSVGAYLVYRVMNKPDSHIGSRLPKDDPSDAEAGPRTDEDPKSGPGQG